MRHLHFFPIVLGSLFRERNKQCMLLMTTFGRQTIAPSRDLFDFKAAYNFVLTV